MIRPFLFFSFLFLLHNLRYDAHYLLMSAFYPGAGTDLTPPILFPEIKTWYYLDSQPRSEYGAYPILSRPTFINTLDQTMSQCHFELSHVKGDLRTYYSPSTQQTIYYETNTNFPEDWNPTRHKAGALVLCGYDIHSNDTRDVTALFSSYPHIITDNTTCDSVWKNDIRPTHTLSQMNYPRDDSFSYWITEQNTVEDIRKHVSVERDLKW